MPRGPLGHILLLAAAALAAFALGRWSGSPSRSRPEPVRTGRLPASVQGRPRVVDGDSLDFDHVRVRLYGVDAFERDQLCKRRDGTHFPCGQFARVMLGNLIRQGTVTCRKKDVDVYRRMVAVCTVDDFDLGAEMVKAGLALAYRRYSDDYVAVEDEARAAHRGVWEGTFEAPWDWRRDKRS